MDRFRGPKDRFVVTMLWNRSVLRVLNRVVRALLAPGWRPRTRRPLPHAVRRILFVKLVGMGDAVLVRSLAEHLRRARADVTIGMLAGPTTREVLTVNAPFTIHLYDPAGADRGLRKALGKVRELRRQSYDLVVDFEQHLVLVAGFLWCTRIPLRLGLAAAGNPRSRFQTHTVPLSDSDAVWNAYAALVRLIEPSIGDVSTLPLPTSVTVRAEITQWWRAHGLGGTGRVAAFHLGCGSSAPARRWPVERFVQLAECLTAAHHIDAVVLTGTPGERALVEQFRRYFRGRAVDASNLGSVERTADVLRRCSLAVCNDTGVMHLAAAMGTPTVGLFGPNSPQRYAPIGPRTGVVYTPRVTCSPCIHIHKGLVPGCSHREQGRCLLNVDVDAVLRCTVQLLHSHAPDDATPAPTHAARETARQPRPVNCTAAKGAI